MALPNIRQNLIERIKQFSREEVILEEMKLLGFWKSEVPELPEQLIKKEAQLNNELRGIVAVQKKYEDGITLLKEMKKTRLKESKKKRLETKKKREQIKDEKAKAWATKKENEIVYLGNQVSSGLQNKNSDVEKLKRYNLPIFNELISFAKESGVTISELRYLCYHRAVSKKSHYTYFEIPKKSGGVRKISAPKKKLKALQEFILRKILMNIPINENVHGFVSSKSIVTNAELHLKKDIVINIDLKDFFPSITFKRVKGMFCKLGYSEELASIFSLICTETPVDKVELDGEIFYVQAGERRLPQGSPASPYISNLISYRMDKKLIGIAKKFGFTYSRYADDLTFSTHSDNHLMIAKLLHFIKKTITEEGFEENEKKTHVMRKKGQRKVTGIVVNEKLNIERTNLRKFRALLHQIKTSGWEGKKWGPSPNIYNSILGYIQFINMVSPEKAKAFKLQLDDIVSKKGIPEFKYLLSERSQKIDPKETSRIENKEDKKDWWTF